MFKLLDPASQKYVSEIVIIVKCKIDLHVKYGSPLALGQREKMNNRHICYIVYKYIDNTLLCNETWIQLDRQKLHDVISMQKLISLDNKQIFCSI